MGGGVLPSARPIGSSRPSRLLFLLERPRAGCTRGRPPAPSLAVDGQPELRRHLHPHDHGIHHDDLLRTRAGAELGGRAVRCSPDHQIVEDARMMRALSGGSERLLQHRVTEIGHATTKNQPPARS
jgi:hypothetical protein